MEIYPSFLQRASYTKISWEQPMAVSTLTVKEIRALEQLAIKKYRVSSLALMENAGAQVAREAIKILGKKKEVLIVCGTGNNGGDGFVAARHLVNQGIKVKIWIIGQPAQLKNDAKINYLILKKLGYPIISVAAGPRDIRHADVVIDAIFGVGLNRDIEGIFHEAIDFINKNAKKILSVDIPSGLDGTTGKIQGICIKADKTVTFSFPKKGFFINDGPRMIGKLIVVDIGIPKKLKDRIPR